MARSLPRQELSYLSKKGEMRAFIALELPKETKKELKKIQKNLAKAGLQATWVKPEKTHLTLAFLGSIKPEKAEVIGQILKKVTAQIKPVKLHFLKVSGFPNPTKARVVFVELGGEKSKLHTLALKIRKELKKEKIWFNQKPFTGHLTLGRIKKPRHLTEMAKGAKINRKEFIANQVSLTQSQLTSSGPIYTVLKKFKL